MAFDWKRLERAERRNVRYALIGVGTAVVALGLVRVVWSAAEHSSRWIDGLVEAVIGIVLLVFGLRGRRTRGASRDD